MNLETQGKILHGSGGAILFGSSGTVLHAGLDETVFVEIYIEWDEGDIDICGYFTTTGVSCEGRVGYNDGKSGCINGAVCKTPKSYASWVSNDKVQGGPEIVRIGPRTEDGHKTLDLSSNAFRVHLNRFTEKAPERVTVRAKDRFGNELSIKGTANENFGSAAWPGDPKVDVYFSREGRLSKIE